MTNLADLTALKAAADSAYHNDDDPIMTDAEYDALILRIRAEGGDITTVGAATDGRFPKFRHVTPMMSLDNAFTRDDVADWYNGIGYTTMTAQPKLDGLSLALTYIYGKLDRAVTRGDGEVGEDVTAQAEQVEGVPITLTGVAATFQRVEVRGEVVMPKSSFIDLNEALAAQGKKLLANPRNAAAGSLRQKDPAITRQRGLKFIAFGVTPDTFPDIDRESDCLMLLETTGFEAADTGWVDCEHVHTFCFRHDTMAQIRSTLPFDIDGLVYKVDSRLERQKLGSTSRAPKWAIAHKFSAEQAVTKLLSVDWQVGRTGIIAPVARLAPINVGGVLVSSATLHNIDEIARLDLHLGDMVTVQRAGDVIPQIVGVAEQAVNVAEVRSPEFCPSCGGPLVRQDAYLRCLAGKDCDAQFLGFLEHFVSRDAMNIDGLGPSQIKDLFDAGWLIDASDIMALPGKNIREPDASGFGEPPFVPVIDVIAEWKGWGKTSAKKLLNAITKARKVDLDKFIYALGIPQVGRTTSKDLAKWCGSVDAFFSAINTEGGFSGFQSVDGIGDATIAALEEHWFDYHRDEVFALRRACDIQEPKQPGGEFAVLAGITIVFTGGLNRWSRETASLIAEDLGAKVAGSISKKTTVLVAGSNTGKVKIAAAVKCETEVWTEFDFIQRVEEAIDAGYVLDVME